MIGKLEVGVIVFLVLTVAGLFAFGQLADVQGSQTVRISGERILIDDPNGFLNITDGSNWSKLSGSGNVQLSNVTALPTCDSSKEGSFYYNGTFYRCNGTVWSEIGAGGVSAFKDLTFDSTSVDMQEQELDNLSKVGSIESVSSQSQINTSINNTNEEIINTSTKTFKVEFEFEDGQWSNGSTFNVWKGETAGGSHGEWWYWASNNSLECWEYVNSSGYRKEGCN